MKIDGPSFVELLGHSPLPVCNQQPSSRALDKTGNFFVNVIDEKNASTQTIAPDSLSVSVSFSVSTYVYMLQPYGN